MEILVVVQMMLGYVFLFFALWRKNAVVAVPCFIVWCLVVRGTFDAWLLIPATVGLLHQWISMWLMEYIYKNKPRKGELAFVVVAEMVLIAMTVVLYLQYSNWDLLLGG